jgi:hypothetical protein
VAALIKLFPQRFDATIADLRSVLQSGRLERDLVQTERVECDLVRLYDRLTPVDFSQDLLARQTDRLRVVRLLRCGWWPLKSPSLNAPLHSV